MYSVFDTGRPFQPSLMFVSKVEPARVKHLSSALIENVRLGCKWRTVTNTLAYFTFEVLIAVVKFYSTGACAIKLFTVVIYGFSY
jgi:hypothetical protein